MRETQKSIAAWQNQTFPGNDPRTPERALRVLDELVEYLLARGASPQDIVQRTASALAREPQAHVLREAQGSKLASAGRHSGGGGTPRVVVVGMRPV